jgi:hypothetical protein
VAPAPTAIILRKSRRFIAKITLRFCRRVIH